MNFNKHIIILMTVISFYSCHTNKEHTHWAYITEGIPFGSGFEGSDSIPIPDSVYLKFEEFMDSVFLHSTLTELHANKEECYQRIFFVIPTNSNVLNFVMYYMDEPFNYNESFVFISYDLESKQYSHHPLELDAFCILDGEVKFESEKYRLITLPIFRLYKEENIFIVKQRRHNGNVYNAVEEHWVEIRPDMSLSPLFVIETLAFVPFDETHKKIVRKLKDDMSLHITLVDSANNSVSNIGQATLFKNNNGLYEWIDIQLSDTIYKDLLFSCDILL